MFLTLELKLTRFLAFSFYFYEMLFLIMISSLKICYDHQMFLLLCKAAHALSILEILFLLLISLLALCLDSSKLFQNI